MWSSDISLCPCHKGLNKDRSEVLIHDSLVLVLDTEVLVVLEVKCLKMFCQVMQCGNNIHCCIHFFNTFCTPASLAQVE